MCVGGFVGEVTRLGGGLCEKVRLWATGTDRGKEVKLEFFVFICFCFFASRESALNILATTETSCPLQPHRTYTAANTI